MIFAFLNIGYFDYVLNDTKVRVVARRFFFAYVY